MTQPPAQPDRDRTHYFGDDCPGGHQPDDHAESRCPTPDDQPCVHDVIRFDCCSICSGLDEVQR